MRILEEGENGFTKFDNEILEKLVASDLSGHEFKIVLLVIRKIKGFNKETDKIALSQMMKAARLSKTRCSQIINSLQLRKIVTVTEKCNGICKEYRINKALGEWRTVTEKCNRYRKVKPTVTEKCNRPLQKSVTTKETITKETITKDPPVEKSPGEIKKPEKVTAKKTVSAFGIWIDVNREFGRSDPLPTGRDTQASKQILALLGGNTEKLTEVYRRYLEDNDKFIISNGHGLSFLQSRINKYLNAEPADDDGYDPSEGEAVIAKWEIEHPEAAAEHERKIQVFLKKKAEWEAVHGKGDRVRKTD